MLGARAITLAGVSGTVCHSEHDRGRHPRTFGQLAYTALGAYGGLSISGPAPRSPLRSATGLAVAGLLAAAFLAVQRRGFDLLDRFARMLGRGWADKTAAGAAALHAALREIYRRRRGFGAAFCSTSLCWIASTLEAWVALRLAGAPLGFRTVLVIESLLYAARSAAFAVPNAVGVQEGAYVLLGASSGSHRKWDWRFPW